MFKERVKSSVIVLLLINLIFMTCQLWFADGLWQDSLLEMVMELPLLRDIRGDRYSIPMERLSAPQKILINDGTLWIAFYNSDAVFEPIEDRTRGILEGFLRGEAAEKRSITTDEWQSALENVSVYVEYPITYTVDMLCAVMGVDSENAPDDVSSVRDFIIVPSDGESGIFLLVRDALLDRAYIYRFPRGSYSLSKEDLSIYTENSSGYYEPAFSTGVEPEGVALDPMVLFSDSRPDTAVLSPINPIASQESRMNVLKAFFNNIDTAESHDYSDGTIAYVENYGDALVYPGGLFEYKSISGDKGVEIANRYASNYETVNAAIRFAENLWSSVSREPLSMLVTSDLTVGDSGKMHITMDYYYDGRPVAVSLAGSGRSEPLNHGVEIDIENGMIVSYRQIFRRYESIGRLPLAEEFVSALDYFVNSFSYRSDAVINDIYIGYMDRGEAEELDACWLARVEGDEMTYAYEMRREAEE